jgi:threonylcarbamoyladenosine tRNA methylthiotransferase MtaB
VFPYSTRKGTKAENFEEVPQNIIKERLKQVQELKKQGFNKYLQKNLKKIKTVLIENEHEGLLYGHTENYIKVYVAPEKELKHNEFYKVKLISVFKDGVIGKYIK